MDALMTYVLTYAISGLIQHGISHFNHKQVKKYQSELKKRNMKEALHTSQILYKEKQEWDNKMYHDILEQQRLNNAENIRIIAEHTEAWEKWPLLVPPVALRGRAPLLSENNKVRPERVPIYLVLAPGSDTASNSVLLGIEEWLQDFISNHLCSVDTHNVIFLNDTWRNPIKPCDEIVCRNIQSFVPDIPMIVIYPVGKGNEFEISHWNILSQHLIGSDGDVFGQRIAIEDNPLPSIGKVVASLADMYYWSRYHIPPTLPALLHFGILASAKDDERELNQSHALLIKSMIENGLLHLEEEFGDIIAFCRATDRVVGRSDVFEATGLLDEIPAAPFLKLSTQEKLWHILDDSPEYSHLFGGERRKRLIQEWGLRVIDEKFEKENILAWNHFDDADFKEIIEIQKDYIISRARAIREACIDQVRSTSTITDRRKWIRPHLKAYVTKISREYVMPQVFAGVDALLKRKLKLNVRDFIGDNQGILENSFPEIINFHVIEVEILKRERIRLKKMIEDVDKGYLINRFYIHELRWADLIANRWIEYVFLGEDKVYDIRHFSKREIEEQDLCLYESLEFKLRYEAEKYCKDVLKYEEPYSSDGYSSSDSPDFFDTVMMSPSF